ncbi:Ltp family lipoprotein [Peribacillus sp. NJ11]|uniref:Ltp family lipoprotein n=1 Tax=Peribacillus sp. NJ11 TaxID=3055861 RepID=UPI0025A1B0BE|nr:Ltp family lipoprotein [Peribacillus sp. NJ11]MDM5223025.1 Ltp family lipoprotein [Peribacillus sp. NJ11]
MKKFFKIGCLGFIGLIVLGIIIGIATGGDDTETKNSTNKEETKTDSKEIAEVKEEPKKAEKEEEPKEPEVPTEYKSALQKAESYAETMSMSKQGIYDQLTSEAGEQFPEDAAQYAIDNIKWDWKENALKKAKQYTETMAMSKDAVYDQLISEAGEQFTPEEAQYAIDNLDK